MTPNLLSAAGRCLHGQHWQVPLSRDLSVSGRTMRRWAKNGVPLRSEKQIVPQLIALIGPRRIEMGQTQHRLNELLRQH